MRKTEHKGASILVADDSEGMRELLSDLLSEQGYQVVRAADGEEALNKIRQEKIDLALLDVMMPHRTGFAVCRAIKANPGTRLIPVVLVTQLDNKEDRVQGIESGADDFLSKPVYNEELLARVRSLLRIKHFTDQLENAEAVLFTLALSIEAKDPYTEGHCERLSQYSVALANRLGLPKEQQEALRWAGIVHDIGKVAVSENILQKPGPLTPEERKIMEQHTVVGDRICAPLKSFQDVLPVIRHHHERMDGTGYPDGLKGDEIPLTARILTVVDIYDALTTDRPYHKALPREDAFRQMREEVKRGWWDGSLVDELEALLRDSPPLAE
ncbi:MAG: response regulator [Acidobacteria bacterium]|nr:response regulator [Acidobacteriota bacterium]